MIDTRGPWRYAWIAHAMRLPLFLWAAIRDWSRLLWGWHPLRLRVGLEIQRTIRHMAARLKPHPVRRPA